MELTIQSSGPVDVTIRGSLRGILNVPPGSRIVITDSRAAAVANLRAAALVPELGLRGRLDRPPRRERAQPVANPRVAAPMPDLSLQDRLDRPLRGRRAPAAARPPGYDAEVAALNAEIDAYHAAESPSHEHGCHAALGCGGCTCAAENAAPNRASSIAGRHSDGGDLAVRPRADRAWQVPSGVC